MSSKTPSYPVPKRLPRNVIVRPLSTRVNPVCEMQEESITWAIDHQRCAGITGMARSLRASHRTSSVVLIQLEA